MNKPDFFIIGAPKCGTTALNAYLSAHPDIGIAAKKEMHHFSTDLDIPANARYRDEATYLACFEDTQDAKRVGEASVWYLFSKEAARNIQRFNPDSQIIAMLRNPVEMIYSLHSQLVFGGDEPIESFEEALEAEPERQAGRNLPTTTFAPVEAVLYHTVPNYSEQLARYFDLFGRERVHVIIYDDFKIDTARSYRATLDFLDVDPTFQPVFEVVNPNTCVKNRFVSNLLTSKRSQWYSNTVLPVGRKIIPDALRRRANDQLRDLSREVIPREPMPEGIRVQLQADFRPYVKELSDLLGRNLSHWVTE